MKQAKTKKKLRLLYYTIIFILEPMKYIKRYKQTSKTRLMKKQIKLLNKYNKTLTK